jgi:carboxymethylenebutenolidase
MPVPEERIEFTTTIGAHRALLGMPSSPPPWPAVIVVHTIVGLASVEQRVRDFAQAGYLAIAPDLYTNDAGFAGHDWKMIEAAARMSLGLDDAQREAMLQGYKPHEREQILAARTWIGARPTATYFDIVRDCYTYVRERPDVRAIGCIGYCMGGRLSAELAASGADLAAAVIYYGPSPKAESIPNIRCPVEGHYAVTDRGITGKVYDFALAMRAAGKSFNYSVYDGAHGFAERAADVYNAELAQMADGRSNAFLAKCLLPTAS